jgi:hypothetical protein
MAKPIKQRLVEQLKAKGHPEKAAQAIAQSHLHKTGSVTKSGEMTAKGRERSEMGAAGRAKDRAARAHGGKPSDYVYNPQINSARRKDK